MQILFVSWDYIDHQFISVGANVRLSV